jgi:hypothetical protein
MGHHATIGDVLPAKLNGLDHVEMIENVVERAVVWQALEELTDGLFYFQRCLLLGWSTQYIPHAETVSRRVLG